MMNFLKWVFSDYQSDFVGLLTIFVLLGLFLAWLLLAIHFKSLLVLSIPFLLAASYIVAEYFRRDGDDL